MISCLTDMRILSAALKKGDLETLVHSKGYILSNLKGLQSNLRHMTWQTKRIAKGDFTQQVDFLGDFSVAFNEMVLKLKEANIKLIKKSMLDPLTQIPNRLSLNQYLRNAFEDARTNETSFSVISFDIDFFKKINDTYGHGIGDTVLEKTAAFLAKQFRDTDLIARYGGEEFMAVLPEAGIDVAIKIGERTIKNMEKTPVCENPLLYITLSAGISELADSDTSYENIIKRSDDALFLAKRNGRNCISVQ